MKNIIIVTVFFLTLTLLIIDRDTVFSDIVDDHIALLESYDDDQRESSAKALGNYHDPRAVNALIRALNDSEEDVLIEAARSLGRISDPSAVEPLIGRLHHPDSSVRGTVAEALGNIGDPRAIVPLENVLNTDWNPFLKGVVSDAINKCKINIGKINYEQKTMVQPNQTLTTYNPSTIEDEPAQNLPSLPIEKIAILPFRDTAVARSTTGYGEAVSEMITTAFIKTNIFEVIERAQIKKILTEQEFSISGSVDADTAIELGRILGVKYLVIGSVAHLGSLFEIDVRMIETKSGKGIIAENSSSNGEFNLRNTVNSITDNLSAKYIKICRQ
ncbi:HEAT repeat domain-containing protein [bacterium]|nr:HEAT repeat domain-containing protein [bacterium]